MFFQQVHSTPVRIFGDFDGGTRARVERKQKMTEKNSTHLVKLLPRPHARAAVLLLAGLADGIKSAHDVEQIVRVCVMTARARRGTE